MFSIGLLCFNPAHKPSSMYTAAALDSAATIALIIVGVLGAQLGFLSPAAAYAMLGVGAGYGLAVACGIGLMVRRKIESCCQPGYVVIPHHNG